MKKRLLALGGFVLISSSLFAQKFELSVQANSGLLYFGGKSTTGIDKSGLSYGDSSSSAHGKLISLGLSYCIN